MTIQKQTGPGNAQVAVYATTSAVLDVDIDKAITNFGAAGAVVLTLPTVTNGTTQRGKRFRVLVETAQTVDIALPASHNLKVLGTSIASGSVLRNTGVIGAYVELESTDINVYQVTSMLGTWSVV